MNEIYFSVTDTDKLMLGNAWKRNACFDWSDFQKKYRKLPLISPGLIQLRKGF